MSEVTYEGDDLEVLAQMPKYYSWIMETFAPVSYTHLTLPTILLV